MPASMRLRDLIRSVRQTKTAQQERDVIAKEAAALRQAFKEQDSTYRHRNVAKLMFMHMLGYPTHFGQMETLKLIASNGYPEKRIGYLGLMILLDERQEVLMLVTNSLKNDLNSRNQYIVGLALTALGNICSAEMARDLGPEVEKLLASNNPYLRKKAALCARRVVQKVPDMLESFVDRSMALLNDRNHAVILAGATLMLDIADQEPATIPIFRDQVPLLCRILRALSMGGFSAEYDVGGIADPYLQVKILRLLRVLAHGDADASDTISDVLAQVATNTEASRSAGNAILYECVRTIMTVESIGGLRVLAVNTLGRFLTHRDNNIRYVALTTLARVVAVDAAAVQRHRATIVECVKDGDASIRRKALELIYALVNEGNVKALTAELLDYLRICDPEFKSDLTAKICMLVQRFAPDKRWYIDSMVRALTEAGTYVKEEACRALIALILNAKQLHGYSARSMYSALTSQKRTAAPALVMVAVWCVGEYGDLVISGAGRMEGEEVIEGVSAEELLSLVSDALENKDLPRPCHEYAVSALAKLSVRCPKVSRRVRALLDTHSTSVALEEQNRSVEFVRLFEHEGIRAQVLDHMPAMEESSYDAALEMPDGATAAEGSAASAAVDLAALLGLDVGAQVDASASGSGPTATNENAAATALDGLADIFDQARLAAPIALTGASNLQVDGKTRFRAYMNDEIEVTFAVAHGSAPAATDICVEVKNMKTLPITGFSLQAAVPKFMQLKLDPASGTVVPPNGSGLLTQNIHVTNSMVGQKPLVVRLRLSYAHGASQKVHQAEVNSFPAGF